MRKKTLYRLVCSENRVLKSTYDSPQTPFYFLLLSTDIWKISSFSSLQMQNIPENSCMSEAPKWVHLSFWNQWSVHISARVESVMDKARECWHHKYPEAVAFPFHSWHVYFLFHQSQKWVKEWVWVWVCVKERMKRTVIKGPTSLTFAPSRTELLTPFTPACWPHSGSLCLSLSNFATVIQLDDTTTWDATIWDTPGSCGDALTPKALVFGDGAFEK